MKVLIFSDVHGNLPAFEKMIKTEGSCDEYICLGDLVNYGPWSNECVDLALSLPFCQYIMGNHEEAFINGCYPGNNELVKLFFAECISGFDRYKEIKAFKENYVAYNYHCQHTVDNKYIYPDTDIQLDSNYIIGHSHHQFAYSNNGFNLFNTGSVGQNRRFINVINYIIFETEHSVFELKSLQYDIEPFLNELKIRRYPIECYNYYNLKLRL